MAPQGIWRHAAIGAVAAALSMAPAQACPCCPTCDVCTCCPTCGSSPQPTYQPNIPGTGPPPTQAPSSKMICDLNCYGDASISVPLSGGDGHGVKAESIEVCRSLCMSTQDCESIVYGQGMCWGKKDVRTSKCQDGDGYTTEMLNEMPFGTCTIMGDPHVVTFDQRGGSSGADPMTQTEAGEYWLVQSKDLQIQGRFGFSSRFPSASSLTGVVITGGLVLDNHLEVAYMGPQLGQDGFRVWWNGEKILNTGFPAFYADRKKQLIAAYNNMNPSNFSNKARSTIGGVGGDLPSFRFTLAPDIMLYVLLGQETMNAVITMRKLSEAMDGYCGNFNCDASDDDQKELERRGLEAPVKKSRSLFNHDMPEKQAKKHGHRPQINDCWPDLLKEAEAACKPVGEAMLSACVFDYCASGGSVNQVNEDKVAAALTRTVQYSGVFGALRLPILQDLHPTVQGFVVFVGLVAMMSSVAVGLRSRQGEDARGFLDLAAGDSYAASAAQDGEEEALLTAAEHDELLA